MKIPRNIFSVPWRKYVKLLNEREGSLSFRKSGKERENLKNGLHRDERDKLLWLLNFSSPQYLPESRAEY